MRKRPIDPVGAAKRRSMLGLYLLLPFLMGGCPEFRADVGGAFEAATRSALLGVEDVWTISRVVRGSLVDATIDLVFDQIRTGGD